MKNAARNSQYMKMSNRRRILNIIRKQRVFRAELARQTGLTRAAVTNIVDELKQEGIVIEKEVGEADYGRKPIMLDINENRYYAFGLYLSRAGCSLGIVNLKGSVVIRKQIDISRISSADDALMAIVTEIESCIAETDVERDRILGLGVSAPGPLDSAAGIILDPPNFDIWRGIKISERLGEKLNMKVSLENNSSTLALAEKDYGAGKDFRNFMLLVVDTGIGAGIVIDDKLYKGVGGFGGEVGHISIDINGRRCNCGNKGCLETYASISAVLRDVAGVHKDIRTWETIVDQAIAGDPFCKGIVEKEAAYLSAGIVNVLNVLELEAVILTGYIKYKPEILLASIRNTVNATSITRGICDKKIYMSSLPDDIDIVSAASLIINEFYSLGGAKNEVEQR
jgi:predicted NBD/HSP70 family sugar kinase